MYRVWTKDFNGQYSIMTDWQTYSKCQKFIYGRWHHWPPFAFISKAKTTENFVRYNGDKMKKQTKTERYKRIVRKGNYVCKACKRCPIYSVGVCKGVAHLSALTCQKAK